MFNTVLIHLMFSYVYNKACKKEQNTVICYWHVFPRLAISQQMMDISNLCFAHVSIIFDTLSQNEKQSEIPRIYFL